MEYYKLIFDIILIYGLTSQGECTSMKRSANASEDTLIVTTILETPFVMLVEGETNADGSPKYEGFLIDLWEELAQIIGIKYKIMEVKDKKYGSVSSNGEWNGMIGELMNRKADVALAALTITYMRDQVVDFTQPFLNTRINAMLKRDLGIDDIEDLLENEEVSYGCVMGGSTMSRFRSHKDPTVEKMSLTMENKTPSAFVKSTIEGAERAKQGNYAFIGETTTIDYIVAHDCELMSFPLEYFPETGMGLAFPRGSKYRDQFSAAILSMRESREIQRLYKKWWKGTCAEHNGSSKNIVNHVVGSMLVLLSALVL